MEDGFLLLFSVLLPSTLTVDLFSAVRFGLICIKSTVGTWFALTKLNLNLTSLQSIESPQPCRWAPLVCCSAALRLCCLAWVAWLERKKEKFWIRPSANKLGSTAQHSTLQPGALLSSAGFLPQSLTCLFSLKLTAGDSFSSPTTLQGKLAYRRSARRKPNRKIHSCTSISKALYTLNQ